jgi:hypothetical protein
VGGRVAKSQVVTKIRNALSFKARIFFLLFSLNKQNRKVVVGADTSVVAVHKSRSTSAVVDHSTSSEFPETRCRCVVVSERAVGRQVGM